MNLKSISLSLKINCYVKGYIKLSKILKVSRENRFPSQKKSNNWKNKLKMMRNK